MSDFPSIKDMIGKTNASGPQDEPVKTTRDIGLKISTDLVEEKFDEKIEQVGIKEREVEVQRKAALVGFPYIDLEKFPVSQQALKTVSREDVAKYQAVCFYFTPEQYRIGAIDPNNPDLKELMDKIHEATSSQGTIYIISEHGLKKVLKMYEHLPIVKPISKDVSIKEEDLNRVQADVTDFSGLQALLEKTSTSDLVTLLLGAALKLEASDLHVEAEEEGIMVRVRMDGILHDAAKLEKSKFNKLLARIKLISSLKINITTKPQDGRFTIKLANGSVDIRVSTMPTIFGESIVMRLLPQRKEGLTLEKVGLYGEAYERLKREIDRPNGMIITTGPTGSGKTTTLYSILFILNEPGVKIITLEDPVEYRMKGVNQSQVDASRDYTFAKGLRSILRQDPDIAMVGEIRDLETAEIAVQAALTGHLMLSTLHTNSAAAAIPRMLSMGVKPFLLSPALNCIIGQRLIRRICNNCKIEDKIQDKYKERIIKVIESMPEEKKAQIAGKEQKFYTGSGCEECHKIGFKGRIGIYEVLVVTEAMEEVILSSKLSEYEIERIAVKDGMVTMVQDGILKALEGITSVEEVFRVAE